MVGELISRDTNMDSRSAVLNTEKLTEFLLGLTFEDLSPEVVEQARWILIDTVGCMLGGATTDSGESIVRVLSALSERDDATIVGTSRRADSVTAAFANSVLADALDFEDTDTTLPAHLSAASVPAALAVGESVGASGRDLLTAMVAGYEIGGRVGRAICPTPERAAVVCWNAFLGFCATAAAGRLLGLSREQFLDAFGYVGASSPVPVWCTKYGRPAHWLKNNLGEQVRAGVLAAWMATGGVLAPRQLLDSELGFWRMAGSDRYRPEELTRGLGESWVVLDATFKPYPCCRYIHTTLDAVRALVEEYRLDPKRIERVVVRSFGEMTNWFADYRPMTLVDAQFSVPYVVALTLLGRAPGPGWYDSRILRDPEVLALAERVYLERSEEYDTLFWRELRYVADVELTTDDGRRFQTRRDWPRGGREVPLTEEELSDKFLSLARTVLPADRGPSVLTALRTIDRCQNVRSVTRALAVIS